MVRVEVVSVSVSFSTFLLKHTDLGWQVPQSPTLCKEHNLSSNKAVGWGPLTRNNNLSPNKYTVSEKRLVYPQGKAKRYIL